MTKRESHGFGRTFVKALVLVSNPVCGIRGCHSICSHRMFLAVDISKYKYKYNIARRNEG